MEYSQYAIQNLYEYKNLTVESPAAMTEETYQYPKTWPGGNWYTATVVTGNPIIEQGKFNVDCATHSVDNDVNVNPSNVLKSTTNTTAKIGKDGTFRAYDGKILSHDYVTIVSGKPVYGPWVQLEAESQMIFIDTFSIWVPNEESLFSDFMVVGSKDGINFEPIYRPPVPLKKSDWTLNGTTYEKNNLNSNQGNQNGFDHLRLIVLQMIPFNYNTSSTLTYWLIKGSTSPTQYVDMNWKWNWNATTKKGYQYIAGNLVMQFGWQESTANTTGIPKGVEVFFPLTFSKLFTIKACEQSDAGSGNPRGALIQEIINSNATTSYTINGTAKGFKHDPDFDATQKPAFYWVAFGLV